MARQRLRQLPLVKTGIEKVDNLLSQWWAIINPRLGDGSGGGTDITVPVTVPDGGTGDTSFTEDALLVGNGMAAIAETPPPVNVGDVPTWDGSEWTMAPTATSGATGGPTGSTTVVPVITYADGLLTAVTTATISGTVPNPTITGQFLASQNGSTWTPTLYPDRIDVPPASPTSVDDEFDASTLDAKWTREGTVNVGTIAWPASAPAATTVLDLTSERGKLLLQAGNTVGAFQGIYQDISAFYAANSTVVLYWEVEIGHSSYTGNNESFQVFIADSLAKTNFIQIQCIPGTANYNAQFGNQANPAAGSLELTTLNRIIPVSGPLYFALRGTKVSTTWTWQPAFRMGRTRWTDFAGATATSTWTPTYLFIRTRNSVTPNSVMGVDFIRCSVGASFPGGG